MVEDSKTREYWLKARGERFKGNFRAPFTFSGWPVSGMNCEKL